MELRNFWWLLIWMFLFGAISLGFIPKREEIVLGKPEIRWGKLPAAVLALPYVIWAGFRENNFGDTAGYRLHFLRLQSGISNLGSFLSAQSKDRGFELFNLFFKTFISDSDTVYFLIIAAIQLYCIVRIYRKYSENYWLSLFMFIASCDYLSYMHNGMRQFLAVSIIFTSLPLFLKKKQFWIVVIVLLVSQIHLSALIFLPFVFVVNGKSWNFRTLLFIVLLVGSLYFLDAITGFISNSMRDTAYEGNIDLLNEDDGTNIFRVLFYSLPAIASWAFRSRISEEDDPLINLCVNMSVVSAGLYVFSYFTSGMLIGRLPIYFSLANYILIPWLVKEMVTLESSLLIQGGIVAAYVAFFYVQCSVWGFL